MRRSYHGRAPSPRAVARAANPPTAGVPDNIEAAKAAGLRYITDTIPGIRRIKTGPKSFRYIDPEGRKITDDPTLGRIKSLVIPPAWTDVWISPIASSHLQATGRDARGRKQYRYHPKWRDTRDDTKFGRMIAFGYALPQIRRQLEADLALAGLPRPKVLAAVVQLMQRTLIRIGNDEYAKSNNSYGLTTLRDNHVRVNGSSVRFSFRGKSGVAHTVDVTDKRLASIIKRCRDLPGQELFQYIDEEGQTRDVTSGDVNDYLRDVTGEEFTSKDFRTWAGTVLAAEALRACRPCRTKKELQREIVAAIDRVAGRLGNTRAVCRKSYVHPAVLAAFEGGALARAFSRRAGRGARPPAGLGEAEVAVLRLLESAR
jgi:DNA topoisomerase I